MENDIMIRPKCECHSVEMFWHKDKRSKHKGYYECMILKREARVRNEKTETARRKKAIRDKRYIDTPKGFLKSYLRHREWKLKNLRSKAESDLAEIHKQLKELGLEPRQK